MATKSQGYAGMHVRIYRAAVLSDGREIYALRGAGQVYKTAHDAATLFRFAAKRLWLVK